VTTRVPVWILIAIAATLVAGCSSTSGPGDTEDTGYPERTTPDNVLAKLKQAYEDMDCEAYMDCLAEDFVFIPSLEDQFGWVDPLPPSWDREAERRIHENMFGPGPEINRIVIYLATQTAEFDPGSDPESNDGRWVYVAEADIRAFVAIPDDPLVYLGYGDQRFLLQVDESQVGPGGENLWEIVEWRELDYWAGERVESWSWGKLKAAFR